MPDQKRAEVRVTLADLCRKEINRLIAEITKGQNQEKRELMAAAFKKALPASLVACMDENRFE